MINQLMAIDTHAHINHGAPFDSNPGSRHVNSTIEHLMRLNKAANIERVFCSTYSSVLSPKGIEAENEFLREAVRNVQNFYQWVVIDPRNVNTFRQAERILVENNCVGIKIHPPGHGYSLAEFGDRIFSFASEYKAIVQIHPEMNVNYILPMANKYTDVTFIMAHMGSWQDEDSDIKAVKFANNRNVYIDTSGIASSKNNVLEYIVSQAGSDRILFGTDTYAPGFQRGRIEYALISEEDKENILRKNAARLFARLM